MVADGAQVEEEYVWGDVCIHPWEYAVDPFRIAGGTLLSGNRDVSSHLIDTGAGLILLDTTYPQTLYLFLESIRRLGFDPADIRIVVHGHYDHIGGAKAPVGLTGATTAMGERDAFILTERPDLSCAREFGAEFHESFILDMSWRDGQSIRLGDTEIECTNTPGHSPGLYVVSLHSPRRWSGLRRGPARRHRSQHAHG